MANDPTGAGAEAGPLAGLRMVITSSTMIGIQAGQLLADFGVEVVLIEPPGGNPLRDQPAWPAWSRGLKSIELDLHDPADAATARSLAEGADVFLETSRPGVAERLGLGYDALAVANPRLVYASVTGFGRSGPLSKLKAYEGVVMAKIGAYDQFAMLVDRPGPAFVSVPYCSYSASHLAVQGILAGLVERTRSGLGQRVDTTMVQGIAAHDVANWMVRIIAGRYAGAFTEVPPVDPATQVPNGWMLYALLVALTKDGRWVQFSQATQKLFHAFLRAMELDGPEWTGAWEDEDIERRAAFRELCLAAVRAKTLAEWQDVFDEQPDVFAEVFRNGHELLDHPQLHFNHHVVTVEHPKLGPVRQPGPFVAMETTPGRVDRPGPALDEHGAELRSSVSASQASVSTTSGLTAPAMPLSGVTILELGTFFAGPFGAALLTDLGARVIKIEQHDGDPIRFQFPMPEVGAVKTLLGKESVAVDINTAEGQELVKEIAKGCDMVLMTFRAGVAKRVGLDEASLRAVNPRLVYHSATGFDTQGPYAHRPAYAPTIGAASGMAYRNIGASVPDGPGLTGDQVKAGAIRLQAANLTLGHADGFSGIGVATALLLGLLTRELGGPAQATRSSMLSTMMHVLSEDMIDYAGRSDIARADAGLYGLGALYRLYETAERWVFLAVSTDREWDALVGVLDDPAVRDARFATTEGRTGNDDALAEVLSASLLRRGAADWEAVMTEADVACVEVVAGPSHIVFMDPGGMASQLGMMTTVMHPVLDEHTRLTSVLSFSRSATQAGPAPAIGEHTDAVLREIGVTDERIAELREAGVVL